MALPINIEDLLNHHKVESNRVEFKKGWNPTSIYHSLCAIANDLDNLGGGYVIVGVEEENGIAKRPVLGVPTEQLDKIQTQMVGFNNLFSPYYLPRVSPEEIDGKKVVVIWAPVGATRPYSIRVDVTNNNDKREAFYVRTGTSSVVAKGDVLKELQEMASRVPFDNRGNIDIQAEDIDFVLLRDYLQKAGSKMVSELKHLDTMDVLERMDLLTGPTERRLIKNVAAMMFCNDPKKFFPQTQISVVIFPDGVVKNPNRFTEKTFRGSVPTIIRGALQYLKDVVIAEYVSKPKDRAESDRWFNYPYQALEEAVVNAMYHRDYQEQQEVEVAVEPHEIRILSFTGPDRSIPQTALDECRQLRSRRYRNSRLGEFLKELELTEGRCTGIPTIQDELRKNGSPRATIETDAERTFFLMTIPVHEGCGDFLATIEKESSIKSSAKSSIKSNKILEMMKDNPSVTYIEMAETLQMSVAGVRKIVAKLKEQGKVLRDGPVHGGHWKTM